MVYKCEDGCPTCALQREISKSFCNFMLQKERKMLETTKEDVDLAISKKESEKSDVAGQ